MSKGRYDPKRVAQLEYELLGIPLPPEYQHRRPAVSHLQPMDSMENAAEWDRLLRDNDIEE